MHYKMLKNASDSQLWLSKFMCLQLLVASVGIVVPSLLIIFPLGLYTNLCAFHWTATHQSACSKSKCSSFGELVAENTVRSITYMYFACALISSVCLH